MSRMRSCLLWKNIKNILESKLARHREIRRLQHELSQASISNHDNNPDAEYEDQEAQDEGYDDKSTESIHSQPPSRKRRTSSASESSWHSESSESFRSEDIAKIREDLEACRTFIRNQAGQEISSESPLSRDIEIARIDRTLKMPSLDHFDGTSDPSGFLNTFDGRMAFFGHSEVARCQFF